VEVNVFERGDSEVARAVELANPIEVQDRLPFGDGLGHFSL
jgi:hypothetical protein